MGFELRFDSRISTIKSIGLTTPLRTILALPHPIFVETRAHCALAYSTSSPSQGSACALFEAVDRASDIWELEASRKSSSTEGGLTALQTLRLIQKLSIESQKDEDTRIEVSIAQPLYKIVQNV